MIEKKRKEIERERLPDRQRDKDCLPSSGTMIARAVGERGRERTRERERERESERESERARERARDSERQREREGEGANTREREVDGIRLADACPPRLPRGALVQVPPNLRLILKLNLDLNLKPKP